MGHVSCVFAQMIGEVDIELGFGRYRRRWTGGFDGRVLRECANHLSPECKSRTIQESVTNRRFRSV